nr:TonB-dependent receptor [Steroidobacteraceae bacterium]
MNYSVRRPLAVAVSAICALASAGFAQAQTAPTALEEVVVTARKTSENLQEAPVAVSAFSAETLARRQISSVDDVARFTPGLVFSKAFGRATERPVIRGQSNVLAGVTAGAEAGAAYFIDGIYFPGDVQSLDMADVQRVEVIRGPQSALYGRNTYSGAINFVTRSPSDTFEGQARAAYDSDETDIALRLEGPLSQTLAGSLSLRNTEFDGQWKNQTTGKTIGDESTKSISGVLEWNPTEDVRLRLRGSYSEDKDGTRPLFLQDASYNNCMPGTRSLSSYYTATNGVPNNPYQYFCGTIKPQPIALNDGPAIATIPLPSAPLTATNTTFAPFYQTQDGLPLSGVERERTMFSALFDWDIAGSGYKLTVASAVRNEDRWTGADSTHSSVNYWFPSSTQTSGANAFLNSADADDIFDYSAEMRIESPSGGALRWMLGVFHYEQEFETSTVNFLAPRGQKSPYQVSEIINSSVFGLVEWKFAESWSLTAEGRYAEETKKRTDYPTGLTAPGATPSFKDEGQFNKFTPRVTVKWDINDDLNMYAIYAEGNKPGGLNGVNGIASGIPTFDEETSKVYELGLKATWLDGRLVTNLAAFLIKATDVQLTTAVVNATSSSTVSIVSNQGSADIQGIEVEARYRVIDPLTLSLTYALADSEFTKGCDDFQWTLTSGGGKYNAASPGSNNLNGQGDCSIIGNMLPMSSKHSASFAADWRQPVNENLEFFVNADLSYSSKKAVQV